MIFHFNCQRLTCLKFKEKEKLNLTITLIVILSMCFFVISFKEKPVILYDELKLKYATIHNVYFRRLHVFLKYNYTVKYFGTKTQKKKNSENLQ